jgi:hypothetical protein
VLHRVCSERTQRYSLSATFCCDHPTTSATASLVSQERDRRMRKNRLHFLPRFSTARPACSPPTNVKRLPGSPESLEVWATGPGLVYSQVIAFYYSIVADDARRVLPPRPQFNLAASRFSPAAHHRRLRTTAAPTGHPRQDRGLVFSSCLDHSASMLRVATAASGCVARDARVRTSSRASQQCRWGFCARSDELNGSGKFFFGHF